MIVFGALTLGGIIGATIPAAAGALVLLSDQFARGTGDEEKDAKAKRLRRAAGAALMGIGAIIFAILAMGPQ